MESLVGSAKKLGKYEGENKKLESENVQLISLKKKLTKENQRIKLSLEVSDDKKETVGPRIFRSHRFLTHRFHCKSNKDDINNMIGNILVVDIYHRLFRIYFVLCQRSNIN